MNQTLPKKQFIIAKAIITNDKNEILMVKRKRIGHFTDKLWEFPGGKVEFGEHPSETAIRETLEETGYVITVDNTSCNVISKSCKFTTHISHNIIISYNSISVEFKNSVNDKNVREIKWFKIDQILNNLKCLSGTKELLKRSRGKLNGIN